MLLSDLLQVVNASNFLGIHEMTADGNNYDMINIHRVREVKEHERINICRSSNIYMFYMSNNIFRRKRLNECNSRNKHKRR